jgi:PAS domain S-box-containing protein
MSLRTEDRLPTAEARRLWFFESLDRIHRAMRQPSEVEAALRAAFEVMVDVFEGDRVWLSSKSEGEGASYRVVMEHTRAGWPGALAQNLVLADTQELAALHRELLAQDEPLAFGAGARPLTAHAIASGVQSAVMMAIDPRVDRPHVLGMQRCELARPWSDDELQLFRVIGRRIGDVLATMLVIRELREREHELERAGRIAQIGYWEKDLVHGRFLLSAEMCRILDLPPTDRSLSIERWTECLFDRVHPEDRAAVSAAIAATLVSCTRYDLEYRIIDSQHNVRFLHSRAEIVHGSDGKVERIFGTVQDISDRRRTEERLVASEGLFRAVVDQATDALFLHGDDGCIVDVNRAACDSLGYTRGELLGLLPKDFDTDATPEFHAWLVPKIDAGESVAFDSRHRRKDGTTFPVEVRIRRFKVGDQPLSVSLARDISERKRVEGELRATEERFRELADTIAEVFWVIDQTKAAMLYISPGYERIWGRSCQSLYDSPRSWLEAIHPDDRARVLEAAMTKQESGAYNEEYRIVRPDGKVRWIRDVAFPVRDASGHVQRVVGVARDVTDLRSLQDQLLHAQKMEAIGQLAGGVAHDFNNLLGAILMEAEFADELPDVPMDARAAISEIRSAGERAASLTRQLLLFGRRQAMHPRAHDLNAVVGDLTKLLQRVIGEHIRLDVRLAPGTLILHADSGMLEQVLVNLAVNARDAMPGGGTLTIATAELLLDDASASRMAGAKPGRHAWLSVTDTGTGIPLDILPRIFEPFFTTKDAGHGTGLGLATAFGIVKEHGGWIGVNTTPSRGTTFDVYLPLHDGARAARDAQPVPARGGNEAILLVEDEPQLRRGTRRALERHGYRVVEADSGVDALRLWPEVGDKVSLLLTDVVMPGGIDGFALAAHLRASKPNLAVIFASGYTKGGKAKDGDRFLQKPITSAQLLENVRDALDRV